MSWYRQESYDLAGSYVNDVTRCEGCGHVLDLPHRCSCEFAPLDLPTERVYAWVPEGSSPIKFQSEMMARVCATKFGGQLTRAGQVIASFAVPNWIREIERKAKAAAALPARPGSPIRRAA